jgi:DNA polymerase-3 subunit beta
MQMFKGQTCLSHDSPTASTSTIRATLHSEQLAQALSAVSAAQADGDVGWIQFHFPGSGKVVVSAVSHNMSIRFEFVGDYEGTGVVKVSGRQFVDYVRQLPPEKATLIVDLPSKLTVRCGRSLAKLQLIQDSSFTEVIVPSVGTCLQAKGETLARWVDSFREFVLLDDTRYYANGAYIWAEGRPSEGGASVNAVASDSLRLAKSKVTEEIRIVSNDESAVLLPKKALDEVRRVASSDPGRIFQLRWHQDELFFALESDNYTLLAKCIAGSYPPYEAAIPQNMTARAVLESKTLLESLRRALVFADKNKVLRFLFDGPVLSVTSFTPGQKEDEETIDLLSPIESPIEVNYNGPLLTGLLSVLSGTKATFEWESLVRPVKITGEPERGIEVFYIIVPTRF